MDQVAWYSPLLVDLEQGLEYKVQQQQHDPEYQRLAEEREVHLLCSAIKKRVSNEKKSIKSSEVRISLIYTEGQFFLLCLFFRTILTKNNMRRCVKRS